ncbi:LOW QUALITY PROTEIN: hypothetical protein PanWU01x14_051620 [Parasponia andersonii]|uniref:Uncharacterized protein n=1 Tax=Parasponia andersonii TaxID=3476 RepID=A0A2P5DM12_PARAD|nr:LOW QUALITY PROTEIN: hypothetical protein PanWU01x14_051620 [Parasponia andersonii]
MGYEIVRVTMNNNILTSAFHLRNGKNSQKAGQHCKPNSQRSRFQSRQPPPVIQCLLQDNLHRQTPSMEEEEPRHLPRERHAPKVIEQKRKVPKTAGSGAHLRPMTGDNKLRVGSYVEARRVGLTTRFQRLPQKSWSDVERYGSLNRGSTLELDSHHGSSQGGPCFKISVRWHNTPNP